MVRARDIASRLKFKHAKTGQANWPSVQKCHLALVVSRIDPHLHQHEQNDPLFVCIVCRDDWPFRGHANDFRGFNNNTIGA